MMGNRLSKIYTRTGDDGTTGLGDGTRVRRCRGLECRRGVGTRGCGLQVSPQAATRRAGAPEQAEPDVRGNIVDHLGAVARRQPLGKRLSFDAVIAHTFVHDAKPAHTDLIARCHDRAAGDCAKRRTMPPGVVTDL